MSQAVDVDNPNGPAEPVAQVRVLPGTLTSHCRTLFLIGQASNAAALATLVRAQLDGVVAARSRPIDPHCRA